MPSRLPPPGDMSLESTAVSLPAKIKLLDPPTRDAIDKEARKRLFKTLAGPNGNFDVPTVAELGLREPLPGERSPHHGGESRALKLLDEFMAQKKRVAKVGPFDLASRFGTYRAICQYYSLRSQRHLPQHLDLLILPSFHRI